MIDQARLRSVDHIIVHEYANVPCPDGTASALILRDVLPNARVDFVQHGTQKYAEMPARPGMLFCDIAPPANRAAQFLECGSIVLDHHKSAWPVVERFVDVGLGAFAHEDVDIDRGVSGALLAFRFVWEEFKGRKPYERIERNNVHTFAMHAGIRDTWQKNDPRWRAACAQAKALTFYPWDRWPTEPFGENYDVFTNMFEIGDILLERDEDQVRRLIAQGLRAESARGTRMLVIPTRETSDVAEAMGDEVDIVIGFSFMHDDNREKMIVSTRSRGSFDCRLFCQANGGGGHTRAAGCEVKLDEVVDGSPSPFNLVRAMLDVFEKSGQGIANSD